MQEKAQLEPGSLLEVTSLRDLARAENACARCPLYKNATQAVPGEGRRHARLMLVGEQPGDKEDLAGKPFVGPAGRVLDRALAESGISKTRGRRLQLPDGTAAFVTIHPSFLLRIRDSIDKDREFRDFVADLRAAEILTRDTA
jgi:uracil-DNA glycosylase